jgi:hypothetical protein
MNNYENNWFFWKDKIDKSSAKLIKVRGRRLKLIKSELEKEGITAHTNEL